jgi:hypothetical protein
MQKKADLENLMQSILNTNSGIGKLLFHAEKSGSRNFDAEYSKKLMQSIPCTDADSKKADLEHLMQSILKK